MSDRTPLFIKDPLTWVAPLLNQTATRNLATDNTVLLGTTGIKGALFEQVELKRTGTIASDVVLLIFVRKAGGSTKYLYDELQIPAVTAATNDALPKISLTLPDLVSPVGGKGLRFEAGLEIFVGLSSAIANTANLFFMGGNL